jgi:hypothetical protein
MSRTETSMLSPVAARITLSLFNDKNDVSVAQSRESHVSTPTAIYVVLCIMIIVVCVVIIRLYL